MSVLQRGRTICYIRGLEENVPPLQQPAPPQYFVNEQLRKH
jgi:hypothetical protein